MYPKYFQCYKKVPLNEFKDFIFENYYKQIGFYKENSSYTIKNQKKRSAIVCN